MRCCEMLIEVSFKSVPTTLKRLDMKKPCKLLTYKAFEGCPVGLEPTTFRTTI